jgi:carbon-monoxide dehydrogenase medium subunit
MRPPPFRYVRAQSLDEATAALATDGAHILAGGQSLLPLLNARLIQPALLIDISRLAELRTLALDPAGSILLIGAMVRQATVEASPIVRAAAPLLVAALRHVGSPAIRSQGTVVGSAALADPTAEIPAVLLALGATFVVTSQRGERRLPAAELASRMADELVLRVEIPRAGTRTGAAWREVSHTYNGYALLGVGCQLEFAPDATVQSAHIAFCGTTTGAARAQMAEAALAGQALEARLIARAVEAALSEISFSDDAAASGAYRRDLAAALLKRSLQPATPFEQ